MSTLPKFYWVQQTHTWVIVFWKQHSTGANKSEEILELIRTNASHTSQEQLRKPPGERGCIAALPAALRSVSGSVFLLVCSHQCESSLPPGMVLRFMGIHYRHMVNFSSVHNYKRTFWGQHKKTSRTVDDKISWQRSGIIWPFQKTAIGLFHFVIGSNDNTKF